MANAVSTLLKAREYGTCSYPYSPRGPFPPGRDRDNCVDPLDEDRATRSELLAKRRYAKSLLNLLAASRTTP